MSDNCGMNRGAWSALVVLIAIAICSMIVIVTAFGERPGQVVPLAAMSRDSLGVAVVPSAATGFVFLDGVAIDSSASLAGGEITRYGPVLRWDYILPVSSADSARFTFFIRSTNADISTDWTSCVPASVLAHDGTVDSITAAASLDILTSAATATTGIIDSTDAGGAYDVNGDVMTDARVYATLGTTINAPYWMAYSVAGDYRLVVPISATEPDTFYVWIWKDNRYATRSQIVTFE